MAAVGGVCVCACVCPRLEKPQGPAQTQTQTHRCTARLRDEAHLAWLRRGAHSHPWTPLPSHPLGISHCIASSSIHSLLSPLLLRHSSSKYQRLDCRWTPRSRAAQRNPAPIPITSSSCPAKRLESNSRTRAHKGARGTASAQPTSRAKPAILCLALPCP